MISANLEPRRHEPSAGWDAATFERVTRVLAVVLIAAYRRRLGADEHESREHVATAARRR